MNVLFPLQLPSAQLTLATVILHKCGTQATTVGDGEVDPKLQSASTASEGWLDHRPTS
jgi:hypothetical protein